MAAVRAATERRFPPDLGDLVFKLWEEQIPGTFLVGVNGVACGCKTAHDTPATRKRSRDTQQEPPRRSPASPDSKSVANPGFHRLRIWSKPTVK